MTDNQTPAAEKSPDDIAREKKIWEGLKPTLDMIPLGAAEVYALIAQAITESESKAAEKIGRLEARVEELEEKNLQRERRAE